MDNTQKYYLMIVSVVAAVAVMLMLSSTFSGFGGDLVGEAYTVSYAASSVPAVEITSDPTGALVEITPTTSVLGPMVKGRTPFHKALTPGDYIVEITYPNGQKEKAKFSVKGGATASTATSTASLISPSTSISRRTAVSSILSTSTVTKLHFTLINPLAITTTTIPDGDVGVAYSETIQATGGVPSYTWDILSGLLPPGLDIDAVTGEISGTPTTSGDYTFTVKVTDTTGNTASQSFGITIVPPITPPLVITTTTIPDGDVGVAYSETIQATGGVPPYSWAIISGQLPPGLTIGATTGEISGTPTTGGDYIFTVEVTDTIANTASQSFDITIVPITSPPTITTTTVQDGDFGIAYSETIQATGGAPPYSWAIISGQLPPGLTIGATTGEISGTPTTIGDYSFTVEVTDTISNTDRQSFVITINPPSGCTVPTNGMYITQNTTFCPGTYYLPDGIFILVDDVELDCNGAVLNGGNDLIAYYGGYGAYTGSDYGIKIGDVYLTTDHVIVKNCVIINYIKGIFIDHADMIEIKDNEISNTSLAINSLWDEDSAIHDNEIHHNLHSGVHLGHTRRAKVYDNYIYEHNITWTVPGAGPEPIPVSVCPGFGIVIWGYSKDSVVNNNEIKHICDYGIWLNGATGPPYLQNNDIRDNDIGDCYDYGIVASRARNNTIKYNTIRLELNNLQTILMGYLAINNTIWQNNLYMGARNDPIDNGLDNYWSYGGVGNFYEDTSNCVDANTDGICDDPRTIAGSAGAVDDYPSKYPI